MRSRINEKFGRYYYEEDFDGKKVFFIPFPKPIFSVSNSIEEVLKKEFNLSYEKFVELYSKVIEELKRNKFKDITVVYLLVTDSCNMQCKYCYIEKDLKYSTSNFMSIKTLQRIISFLKKIKTIKKIVIYGGEPLLHPQITKILTILKTEFQKVTIDLITNGTIYSKEISKTIKRLKINIGFSLDGWKELNDKNRIIKVDGETKGTFEIVKQNILRYEKDGISTSLSLTVTHENLKYIPDIVYYFSTIFKLTSVGINVPITKESELFFEVVGHQIFTAFEILNKESIYEDRIGRRLKEIINEKVFIQDCAGYGNQLVFSPSGKINYCQAYYGIKCPTPWQEMSKYNDSFREIWHNYLIKHLENCYGCPFISICGKGCAYRAKILNNREESIDDGTCLLVYSLIKNVSFDLVKNIKWVFFDLDDLIILRPPNLLKELIKKFSLPENIFNNDLPMTNLKRIIIPLKNKNYDYRKIVDYYLKRFYNDAKLNYEVIEVIKELKKKYKIGIYSGGSKKHILSEIERFNIKHLFDGIISAEKRNQNDILKVLKTFDLKRNEMVYITHSIRELARFLKSGIKIYVTNRYPKWLLKVL